MAASAKAINACFVALGCRGSRPDMLAWWLVVHLSCQWENHNVLSMSMSIVVIVSSVSSEAKGRRLWLWRLAASHLLCLSLNLSLVSKDTLTNLTLEVIRLGLPAGLGLSLISLIFTPCQLLPQGLTFHSAEEQIVEEKRIPNEWKEQPKQDPITNVHGVCRNCKVEFARPWRLVTCNLNSNQKATGLDRL